VSSGSAAGATTGVTATGPSVALQGCVPGGQDGSAALISSLRRMEGVQSVSLASSEKTAAPTTTSTGATDCAKGTAKFSLTVTFMQPTVAAPAAGTTTTTSTGVTP
jgi:hypothetical protein